MSLSASRAMRALAAGVVTSILPIASAAPVRASAPTAAAGHWAALILLLALVGVIRACDTVPLAESRITRDIDGRLSARLSVALVLRPGVLECLSPRFGATDGRRTGHVELSSPVMVRLESLRRYLDWKPDSTVLVDQRQSFAEATWQTGTDYGDCPGGTIGKLCGMAGCCSNHRYIGITGGTWVGYGQTGVQTSDRVMVRAPVGPISPNSTAGNSTVRIKRELGSELAEVPIGGSAMLRDGVRLTVHESQGTDLDRVVLLDHPDRGFLVGDDWNLPGGVDVLHGGWANHHNSFSPSMQDFLSGHANVDCNACGPYNPRLEVHNSFTTKLHTLVEHYRPLGAAGRAELDGRPVPYLDEASGVFVLATLELNATDVVFIEQTAVLSSVHCIGVGTPGVGTTARCSAVGLTQPGGCTLRTGNTSYHVYFDEDSVASVPTALVAGGDACWQCSGGGCSVFNVTRLSVPDPELPGTATDSGEDHGPDIGAGILAALGVMGGLLAAVFGGLACLKCGLCGRVLECAAAIGCLACCAKAARPSRQRESLNPIFDSRESHEMVANPIGARPAAASLAELGAAAKESGVDCVVVRSGGSTLVMTVEQARSAGLDGIPLRELA